MTLKLDFHDLVSARISSTDGRLDDLQRVFGYFSKTEIPDPDIVIKIGPFKTDHSNCVLVEDSFYVGKDYVYYEDAEGQASWEFEISGFGSDVIEVRIDSRIKGIRNRFLRRNFLVKDLLTRTLEMALLRRGHVLLHGAAVERDGEASLFFGRGGAFKTTLIMDLVRNHGYTLLGDDHVIVGPDEVLSFPENLDIIEYMLRNLKTERSWTLRNKIEFGFRILTNNYPERSVKITDTSTLAAGYNLSKYRADAVSVKDESDAVSKIGANIRMEDFSSPANLGISTGILTKCMLAHSTVYPDAANMLHHNLYDVLEKNIGSLPFKHIQMPIEYEKSVARQVHEELA